MKNNNDSPLGWTLSKIRVIPKKASDKSFSSSNFGQKSLQGYMSISPWSGVREHERWYGWNMKLYGSEKREALLGWMLPKIRSIPKKASNKSFSTSNFRQKVRQGHMSISSPEWSWGTRKMIWFKYEIVQKNKNTFTLGLNAAENAGDGKSIDTNLIVSKLKQIR